MYKRDYLTFCDITSHMWTQPAYKLHLGYIVYIRVYHNLFYQFKSEITQTDRQNNTIWNLIQPLSVLTVIKHSPVSVGLD